MKFGEKARFNYGGKALTYNLVGKHDIIMVGIFEFKRYKINL